MIIKVVIVVVKITKTQKIKQQVKNNNPHRSILTRVP